MSGQEGDAISKIQEGVTRAEAEAIVGKPVEEKVSKSGKRYFVYRYKAYIDPNFWEGMSCIIAIAWCLPNELGGLVRTIQGGAGQITILYDENERVVWTGFGNSEEFKRYLEVAQCGAAYAADLLGEKYQHGDGVAIDLLESYFWYGIAERLASDPNALIQFNDTNKKIVSEELSPEQIAQAERRIKLWTPMECDQHMKPIPSSAPN
jgi:TPR repeat protein